MEGIEPPLYKSSEVKIYKDSVRPHKLAIIGEKKTVFYQRLGPNDLQIGEKEDSSQLIWEY